MMIDEVAMSKVIGVSKHSVMTKHITTSNIL